MNSVPESDNRRIGVEKRIRACAGVSSARLQDERVKEWARKDDGDFPLREQARQQTQAEYELLAVALGDLALLQPNEVFGRDMAYGLEDFA